MLSNKSVKWHCGCHISIKKTVVNHAWYMNDFWLVVSEKKI